MLEKKVIRKRFKKWPEPLVFKPGGNPTFFWLVPKGSHFLWFCVFCRFLKFLSSEEINQKRSAWGRDVSRYQWGFHITKNIVKNHEILFFWKKQHFFSWIFRWLKKRTTFGTPSKFPPGLKTSGSGPLFRSLFEVQKTMFFTWFFCKKKKKTWFF